MRRPFFIIGILAFLAISCKKNGLDTRFHDGIYKGSFQRSIYNKISNVTLKFSSNKFEGQGEFIHYPDICNGGFSLNKDTVLFVNSCIYTADFDWSYILSGKFKISVFGDSLIMKREYNGIIYCYDIYKLKRG